MIAARAEIMLYVRDVERAKIFWIEKIGAASAGQRIGPYNSTAYAVHVGETIFVLMDRALVERFSPEVNSGMPSIMLCTEHLEAARQELQAKGVEVTEIFEMNGMKTFSFCDDEGNYYAMRE